MPLHRIDVQNFNQFLDIPYNIRATLYQSELQGAIYNNRQSFVEF